MMNENALMSEADYEECAAGLPADAAVISDSSPYHSCLFVICLLYLIYYLLLYHCEHVALTHHQILLAVKLKLSA